MLLVFHMFYYGNIIMIFSLYKNNYLVDYMLFVVMLIIIFYEEVSQRNLLF
ncbi:conserved hypothetical protein [Xenorhabdus bovienii str. kraussei Quebec]|uniref:Uncharacterized protein n=1 Tax=Xenorhabdus bovienii str. kraussei Quebec TaxID=1398203 RepID=A0A077PLB3_XENBV|nr:conserved hypothetical protein [Xenorhabdus bovienii str. kraussei Quebec]